MADKQKALETAISQIEKNFGKGSIMRLGQNTAMNVEAISTGSVTLDAATGIGGLPRGRIIEIYGPESSGKTTLALHVVAEAQRMGGEAAFIDAEHALDPVYAANLGVDVDSLLVSQPDNGEQALEITEALTRSGAIDVIVVDSVAALVPRSEIEGDMGDSHVGLHARLMSQALRKLAGAISKSNTIIIFINQLREKVGVVYGNPEVTTGGRALKFYASIRIDVRKIEQLKGPGNEFIGSRTRAKIVKNKVAPPFKEAEFDIMYGKGISKVGEILDLAVKYDIIHKSGAWFSYNENRLGQGRDNVKNYISEHPDFMAELEAQVRERLMAENNAARAAAKPAEKPTPAAEPAPAAMPKKPTSRSGAKAKLQRKVARRSGTEFAREAVERLEEMGYVNDERYAHTLAQELYERRGMGKKRIEQELRQRGISRETASECAEELDGDDVERIKNLLETKFAGKFSDEKGRRRTFNALTRLGYGYSDIRSAMRSVDEEYEDTDDQFYC